MNYKFTVTLLGSGTSTGVPVIGCGCDICRSEDPINKRLRSSIAIQTSQDKKQIVIDTGPDFRAQFLRAKIAQLDAIFFTHLHSDHCGGLDDVRAFFFKERHPIPCYLSQDFVTELKTRFSYIFSENGYLGVKPKLDLCALNNGDKWDLFGLEVEMFMVPHGGTYTSVYRFDNFLYATDFKSFPPELIEHWRGKVDFMVGSGIHFGAHSTHSNIQETIACAEKIECPHLVITHMAHDVDYIRDRSRIPNWVEFGFDGMTFDVKSRN